MPKESKRGRSAIEQIVRGAIKLKSIIRLLVFGFIAIGIVGLWRMNKDELPTFEIKQGLIAAVYPGADVWKVEEDVAKPLEQLVFSFPEVNRQNTRVVSKDGMCFIYVDVYTSDTSKDETWSKIKLKIDAFKSTLPAGVLAVMVVDDFSAVTSVLVAMTSEDKGYDEMRAYSDDLCARLRGIPELSNVSVSGLQSEEIAVTIDPERMAAYHISPTQLMWNYQTSTIQAMGSSFSTGYTISPIHLGSMVTTEEELYNRIVYTSPDGTEVLRLRDIATVERRTAKPSSMVEYNGTQAVIFSIEMRPDNDIVKFGAAVDEVLAAFSATLPDSVSLHTITDQPEVVGGSVWSFLRDLVISMIVVILVMLLLFPLRSALIASTAVPVCTAVSLAIMFFSGIPMNTVSLAALIVVLGMIVDDSVITMDGFMDKRAHGLGSINAASKSAKELFMPMLMATAGISLMFFPCKRIITGYLGEFVSYFPAVVAFSLMTSLAYAVLVVPSLEVRFIKSDDGKKNLLARIQDKLFAGMQNGYEFLERICFRHPWATIGVGVGTVVLSVVIFFGLHVQMMPMAPRPVFAVEVYLDPTHDLDRTKAVADSVSHILRSDPRVTSVTEFIGIGTPRFHATYAPILPGSNVAQIIVNTTGNLATEQVLARYEKELEDLFPEAFIHVKQMDYQGSNSPVEYFVQGDDYEAVHEVAAEIEGFMHGLDGLKWVHSDADFLTPGIRLDMDAEQATRLGVNRTLMNLSLASSMSGLPLMTVSEDGRDIPVNLYGSSISPDSSYDDLLNTLVPTQVPGVMVPLRQIADISPEWLPQSLVRLDGKTTIAVGADTRMGVSQPAMAKAVEAHIAGMDLPEGVTIRTGGLSSTNAAVIPEIVLSFIAAVAVLFLFLLFHFKKVSLSVLTIVLSCLCLFGAFLGLWLFKLDFSITAALGLISLVGIIVRNGIILFEYAEELYLKEGLPLKEAAMLAGQRRMRPIFLTSCTTALGVLPMILSGDLLWMPMGVVICFGTLLSVVLITLIMPVSYWLIFRRRHAK